MPESNKVQIPPDAEQVEKVKSSFDFIIDTVSAEHDFDFYLSLLKLDGIHILVGIPPAGFAVKSVGMFQLGRKSFVGSAVGGLAETQEMLDFCGEHNIVADIELIDIKDIHAAFDRMEKGDNRYRFVIDMATL